MIGEVGGNYLPNNILDLSKLRAFADDKKTVTSNFFFFPTAFFTLLENFLPFSSSLKLLSANSFRLEESKIRRLGED